MLDETRVLVVKILRRMNVLIKLSICGEYERTAQICRTSYI